VLPWRELHRRRRLQHLHVPCFGPHVGPSRLHLDGLPTAADAAARRPLPTF